MSALARDAHAVVMAAFPGPRAPGWLLDRLAAGLGSVCLFGSNVTGDDAALRALTDVLHAAAPDVLVALDEEGGDVTRLDARTGSPLPSATALAHVDDVALTEQVARALGARLVAVGADLDLAPVADVDADPDNPVIGIRAFGPDAARAAAHVAAYVRGLGASGVAACAKHFPGHGDTRADSHLGLPRIDADAALLDARDLVPFRAAVAAGVEAVMTGHLLVPAVDRAGPASTSAAATALLRERLRFGGVVVTDALDMAGVSGPDAHGGLGAAAVAALRAGADLLCLGADKADADVAEVVGALVAAVEAGALPAGRLGEAAGRVRALGAACRSRRAGAVAAHPDPDVVTEACRRAVDVTGPLPDVTGAVVARFVTAASIAVGAVPWGLAGPLAARVPGVEGLDVTDAGGPDPLDDVLGRAAGRPLVAVVRDAHRSPWVLDALGHLARARPDVVVVETGRDAGRLPAVTTVRTRGASAGACAAAADLLAGATAGHRG